MTTTARPNGIGLGGAMFLLFLGLKLGGVINWSWWWVTAPLWIPLAFLAALVLIVAVFIAAADWHKHRQHRRRVAALKSRRKSSRSGRDGGFQGDGGN